MLVIVVSVAIHLVLISLVYVFAQRAPEMTLPKVVTIRLSGSGARPTAPARPSTKKKNAPEVPTPPVVEPKAEVTPPAPAPPEVKPPKKTSEGEALFGRSEFEAPKGKPAPPSGAPPSSGDKTAPQAATPAIGKAGVASLEGGPFPYSLYIDRMVALIGTHWFRPQGADRIAQIYFVIDRNGTVQQVKVEKSSGDASFDRAAQRAVMETSPLPPLPLAYEGTFLGVHLTFH